MPQWDSIPVLLFCYRVSGRCSHIVGLVQALMHYRQWGMKEIPTEMSCTELQQRWGKPRGNTIKAGSVMSLVCAKAKPGGKMSSRPVTATLTKQRYNPHIKIDLFCFASVNHLTEGDIWCQFMGWDRCVYHSRSTTKKLTIQKGCCVFWGCVFLL